MNKILFLPVAAWLISVAGAGAQPWQIHEWGTFTSLQDESGQSIDGINTDDEPVPSFVHGQFPIIPVTDVVPRQFNKGLPSCYPGVTMRLETPVIYFHPPAGAANGQSADVKVRFRGGWLTEFYPDAVPDAPGRNNRLSSDTVGRLEWNNLQIGGDWPLTNTSAPVWTSPRAVEAASVQASNGESEKFLFYRGVGHIDAPLRVFRHAGTGELLFHSQLEDLPVDRPLSIHSLWLVDIQPDGQIAFRTLPSLALGSDPNKILARTPAAFAPDDFSAANFGKLRASLKSALISEGLYDDEAQALLNTWEVSYFKSPGLRVFFLVPRAWTDYYLPLQISLPAHINRVMVGRIELVTPQERTKLEELASFSPATIREQALQFYQDGLQHYKDFRERPLSAVAFVPKSYWIYMDLGRFRNALILEEEKTQPTPGLASFIASYGLQAYQLTGNPSGS
jgi:hypothetical protein